MRHAAIRFSDIERADLLKAWLATSLAFGIFFIVGGEFAELTAKNQFFGFLTIVGLAAVTAGLGFVGHELMHKFTANRFGVQAEFRSNDTMLVISILISFLGIILAAPGAVMIYGNVTRRENGIISAAGPAANIVLALIFLPFIFAANPIVHAIGTTGLMVNALLGVFNMIPIWEFDGTKILRWSKPVYFTMLIIGGILLVMAYAVALKW
jgi:Zn-dependent protease